MLVYPYIVAIMAGFEIFFNSGSFLLKGKADPTRVVETMQRGGLLPHPTHASAPAMDRSESLTELLRAGDSNSRHEKGL
jgi:hypothetical protein